MSKESNPARSDSSAYLRSNRSGIGMPRCVPRRKRTAKPQRDIYDLLGKMRAGEIEPEVEFRGEDTVVIKDYPRTVVISRDMYDRHMGEGGHTGGVHIVIKNSISSVINDSSDGL